MKNSRKSSRRSAKQFPRKPRFSREVAVLYEDDFVIAVDKPAGLLAVPIEGSDKESALSVVNSELQAKRQRASVVHRIDRFTSGVLLFAKTPHDRNILIRQFLSHTPVRRYLAVVRGYLEVEQGTLVHYFRREGMFQELTTDRDRKAARAELQYSVQRRLRSASLVEVTLLTGLQNQIRVQFSADGHLVIGDRKYSPQEAAETRIDRVALHASYLEFIHPRSAEKLSIECAPPRDFQSLVRSLSQPPARNEPPRNT
jgi:23S rRNA pseudouridine1911/1915/1917 synthase